MTTVNSLNHLNLKGSTKRQYRRANHGLFPDGQTDEEFSPLADFGGDSDAPIVGLGDDLMGTV